MAPVDDPCPSGDAKFDPDVVYEFFKGVWARDPRMVEGGAPKDVNQGPTQMEVDNGGPVADPVTESPKKPRTTANKKALKVASELLRVFVSEAVGRAVMVAEAEGSAVVEGTHLERILPQLLLDF